MIYTPLILASTNQLNKFSKSRSSQSNLCKNIFLNINVRAPILQHPDFNIIDADPTASSSKNIATIATTLHNLSFLVQGKLEIPMGLTVYLESVGKNAFYFFNEIYFSFDYRRVEYKKHPKNSINTFTHEWGHFLSEYNLGKLFPELRNEIDQKNENFNRIFMPYSELFSDVIAVLYSRDGRATRNVLFSSKDSEASNANFSAKVRDFTERHQIKSWSYEEPYALMAPVRTWLWENYLKRPSSYRQSGEILRVLLISIGESVKERLANDSLMLTPKQINEELIIKLHTGLAFLNLN